MRYRNLTLLTLLVVASGTLFAWTGGSPKVKGATTPFPHAVHMENELACIDCHELMKAPDECASCHETYSQDAMPASHKDAGFGQAHGGMVEPYFRQLHEDKCFFCHEVSACETCHRENPPAGHESPHFEQYHGDLIRGEHKTMADANCSVCHDAAGCDACHQQREPRSHTVSFKNRTHGLTARFERESCQTCHKQTFCTHCHTSVEPLSHKGQFARGQQNHCLNCHAPVPHADNGMNCTACH